MIISKKYLSIYSTNVSIEFEDEKIKIYEKNKCIYDISADSLLFIDVYDIDCLDELYFVQLYVIGFKVSPQNFTIVNLSYLFYVYGRGDDYKYERYSDTTNGNIIIEELDKFSKRAFKKKHQFVGRKYELSKFRNDQDKSIYDIEKYKRNYPHLTYIDTDSVYFTGPIPTISRNSGGCYIATAVYGSYDCPEVWTLRRYRDNELARSLIGKMFIRTYYSISPTLVKLFGGSRWFRMFWKKILNRLIYRCNKKGYSNLPYDDIKW